MKIKPETTEVIQLATQAIEYRKKEGITVLDAIEIICGEALVPTTNVPLTIKDVQEYLRLLQNAVSDEVFLQLIKEGEKLFKEEHNK